MAKKPRMGRPPRGGKVSDEIVKLRVTTEERKAWELRAAHSEVTLSEWIRERLNRP